MKKIKSRSVTWMEPGEVISRFMSVAVHELNSLLEEAGPTQL